MLSIWFGAQNLSFGKGLTEKTKSETPLLPCNPDSYEILPSQPCHLFFNSLRNGDDKRNFCGQCRSRSDCTERAV